MTSVEEFGIDLARSILVGDKETDIQAGIAAGVGNIYIATLDQSLLFTVQTTLLLVGL